MQDADLFAFMAMFRELLNVFPKRLDEGEIGDLSKAYFHALRFFSIAELRAGADAWTQRGKFFPKPAEWRESIPRRSSAGVEVTSLSSVEAAEYLEAEKNGWQGEPCGCRPCVSAGVNHRFLRYVPEQDEYGRDLKGKIGERVIVRGRWIHGQALQRWYDARDAYMALEQKYTAKSMPTVTAKECEPHPYDSVIGL